MSAPEGTDTRHDAQVDSPDLTGPYAAACNIYADLGWRGVIPVDPRDKGGVPAGFTGYGGIDVTPANMAWFAKSKPGHNIGLRLPDGIIGIDVDAYDDKKGEQTFAEAQKRWGALPPSYRSTSRGDDISGIRLYRVPAGAKLETIIEFKDLDIRDIEIVQRHHRHVQCWPSIHDKTGQRYRWVSELDGSAMDAPPAPDDLPNLPAAWVAALRAESGSNGTPLNGAEAPVDVQTALSEGDASPRVAELLARAIGDCYGGSRFDHTRGNVLTLLRFGKQGDTGVRPALSALKAVYASAVSSDRAGGQRAAEVEFDRLVSGKKVGALLAEPDYNDWVSDLARANASPARGGAAPESATDAPPDDGNAERPSTIDGATFILDQPDTIPALWGRGNSVLWASGEALMIAGGMGLGKTTLAGQVVGGLMFGGDVLGLPIIPLDDDAIVLYLAMDRPRQIARSMRRQFGEQHRDVLARRLKVRPGPPPADIARNPDLLAVMAQSEGAHVVVIDSVKDAALGLSDDQVGAAYNRARQTLLASGRELCELHHTVKRGPTGGAPSSAADIYGSTWLTAGCGSVVLLTGEPGDPIIGFRHVKQPAEEVGPFRLLHDQAAGRLTVDHVADLVALAKASGPDGLTAKAAAAAMFDKTTPTRADVQKARRKLDDLVDAKRLSRMEGGTGRGHVTAWFEA